MRKETVASLNILTHLIKWGVVLGVGSFVFVFLLFLRNTLLPRYPYEVSLEQLGLHGEELQFTSRDGVTLSGTLLKKGSEDPVVIFCHGLGANRYDLIETVRLLYEKGSFTVFFFDFRAHGKSPGRMSSFGYREQRDLLGALELLDAQKDLSHRYGLYGVSMGASVGILVAAEDSRIKALCVDSPFVDLEESIANHFRLLYPLPKFPFIYFANLSYRILFLTDARNISPLRVVHKISPRPLYIINGREDDRMTADRAEALFEKALEPKKLWLVPGAGHLEGRAVAASQYDESVLNFFSRALRE